VTEWMNDSLRGDFGVIFYKPSVPGFAVPSPRSGSVSCLGAWHQIVDSVPGVGGSFGWY
jgi:hypothetical protein